MSGQIVVLTGDLGSGKTTTCLQFAEQVTGQGLDCAGIVCPARFAGQRKAGIDLLDLRTKERRPLAEADEQPAALRTGMYRFEVDTIAWGMTCLESACPCDGLIIDELGPLELERGAGWTNALDILRAGQFRLAVVVVRPRLVDTFRMFVGTTEKSPIVLHKNPGDDATAALLNLLP